MNTRNIELALEQKMKTGVDFIMKPSVLFAEARERRQKFKKENMCTFGVEEMDNVFHGIYENELVVIGAETGVGKSEIGLNIALGNALKGKNTFLFWLEGDLDDIYLRYMEKEMRKVRQNFKTADYRFNTDASLKALEDTIFEEKVALLDKHLRIFKKEQIPDLEQLDMVIDTIKNWVDIMIIDHLHNIGGDQNEQERTLLSKLVKEFKTRTDILRKPIVLFSHVKGRNRQDRKEDLCEFDLHGTTDIAKQATTILMVQRGDREQYDSLHDTEYPTEFIVSKSRMLGYKGEKLCLVYDTKQKDYTYKIKPKLGF